MFCEKTVPVKPNEDGAYLFTGCSCSQDGTYAIDRRFYEDLNKLAPAEKREQFYLLSGLIREMLELNKDVYITRENKDAMLASAMIPTSLEEKMEKCLLSLHRKVEGPNELLSLAPIEHSYNITYSPSLQEFIYVLEELKTQKLVERRGQALSLTPAGWAKAEELKENRSSKQCFLAVGMEPELLEPLKAALLPKLKESGYEAVTPEAEERVDRSTEQAIRGSDLVIADFTNQARSVYFEAGYAKGLGLKVIGTVRRDSTAGLLLDPSGDPPIVWDTPEDLAEQLQERIAKK
ncbi:hypothetical protein MJA45_23735 [Paenibacillus aurantius]|uniref:Uncharacterized protein n=1 Tax=Paenibacillus aurantius TaxID=2918900 RepID=A0AA96LCF2_9BACL|nr:hypothetical protein [Paenibacillus aurantius]WNQ10598.1 hypothetical protein MJA45_23735 [Paenibacillus aurantius]